MGGIGISRHEFLYELTLWEIKAIQEGWQLRNKDVWEASRLATFYLMSAMPYTDIRKAGIYRETDLVKFSWEKKEQEVDDKNMPSKEEVENIKKMIAEENAKIKERNSRKIVGAKKNR